MVIYYAVQAKSVDNGGGVGRGGIKPTEAGSIVLVTQCVGKKFGSGRWEVGGCPAANPRARLGEEI